MTTCSSPTRHRSLAMLAMCLLAASTGCHAIDFYTPALEPPASPELTPPRELAMVSLPTYRIQPSDILQLEAIRLVPRQPYHIEAYDVLQINVVGTIIGEPINGYYLVEAEGMVSLGPAYGTVRVVGMTMEEATSVVAHHLQAVLQRPAVSIVLVRAAGTQQISGIYPFRVQPDGTINLRRYGMVYVAGKTVIEAKLALEQHAAQYFDSPQISVDVAGYNGNRYYVITAGASMGESVQTFAVTGNDTVLDAISRMQGLQRVSSKTMWLSRPTPGDTGAEEVLPIDWVAIARNGVTDTNYQILPGDRIYIVDDNIVATNNYIAKVTGPIERLLNISSLGSSAIINAETTGRFYNRTRQGF